MKSWSFSFPGILPVLIAVAAAVTLSFAPRASAAEDGIEALTRGPVHEAFAEVVSFEPQAGLVVSTAPPELIEELPPDQRPGGMDRRLLGLG